MSLTFCDIFLITSGSQPSRDPPQTFLSNEPCSKENFFLRFYLSLIHQSHQKLYHLDSFLQNPFIQAEAKEVFLSVFQKTQRHYFALAKLASIWRGRRAPIKVSTDMYMNDISDTQKNVVVVLSANAKYRFLAVDMLRLINAALLNSDHFFPEPLRPKNPFDNVPFSDAALYNIYFFFKYVYCHSSILLDLFFRANFSTARFLADNETLIRDKYIKSYVQNQPAYVLCRDVRSMLAVNDTFTRCIRIDPDISSETIADIFRPYLHLYYLFTHGTYGTEKRNDAYHLLKTRLREFALFNPRFGRKTTKIEHRMLAADSGGYKFRRCVTVSFNLDHMDFYRPPPPSAVGPEVRDSDFGDDIEAQDLSADEVWEDDATDA
jgi:hypothetical protein